MTKKTTAKKEQKDVKIVKENQKTAKMVSHSPFVV